MLAQHAPLLADAPLAVVSAALRAHCLLETPQGRVLEHEVCALPVPDIVVETVVSRRTACLEARLTGRRTELLGGRRTLLARLDAAAAHVVGTSRGRLWLLADADLDGAALLWAADLVESAGDGWSLAEALHEDGVVPAHVLPPGPRYLVAVRDGSWARLDLPHLSAGVHALVVSRSEAGLQRALRSAVRGSAVVYAPVEGRPLGEVQRELDEALRLPLDDRWCGAAQALRTEVLLARAATALADEQRPGLGDDVMDRTVLTWLDHAGDVPATAAALGLHGNTVRYRVRKARAVLGLDDPAVRLLLHLQLRHRYARIVETADRRERRG